ncbi:Mu-like prophage major head subunit gpT family protein [Bradyrhizobium tunisiense]|uniref:phage major capsid protein n=1 Tax=Bradyrhizobium tunisiense TaxID=3278709 RepID=UPI0035E2B8E7
MPAGTITTGNHPKALWPGMHAFFGTTYGEYKEEWRDLVNVEKSSKNYEEDTLVTGFGQMPVKLEGSGVSYDSETQGFTKRYTHTVWGLGYIVTQEEMEDNLYEAVSKKRIKRLAFSARQTKENIVANVYNRAFNTSYTGGDAKALCVTDHPSTAGNWSNRLSTDADLSEASLEDMMIQIAQAKNDRGHVINLKAMKLIVPSNLMFEAKRILKSDQQNDTANNAINALKGMLDYTVNHYLTDADAWFIKTDCQYGLQLFERRALAFTQDNDFDTENAKAKCTMRFSVGWTDPRSLYATQGA